VSEVKGDPVALDECYDPEGTLLEERVILVRARSHEEAISKAEHELKSTPALLTLIRTVRR